MPFCFNETHTDVTVFGNDHWFNDVDHGSVKIEPECNKEICPDSSGKVKKYVRMRDPLTIGQELLDRTKSNQSSDPKSGQLTVETQK